MRNHTTDTSSLPDRFILIAKSRQKADAQRMTLYTMLRFSILSSSADASHDANVQQSSKIKSNACKTPDFIPFPVSLYPTRTPAYVRYFFGGGLRHNPMKFPLLE